MSGFKLQSLEVLLEPEPGNPRETEGGLNPAAVRGPDATFAPVSDLLLRTRNAAGADDYTLTNSGR